MSTPINQPAARNPETTPQALRAALAFTHYANSHGLCPGCGHDTWGDPTLASNCLVLAYLDARSNDPKETP